MSMRTYLCVCVCACVNENICKRRFLSYIIHKKFILIKIKISLKYPRIESFGREDESKVNNTFSINVIEDTDLLIIFDNIISFTKRTISISSIYF